jgi:hypothetical protein
VIGSRKEGPGRVDLSGAKVPKAELISANLKYLSRWHHQDALLHRSAQTVGELHQFPGSAVSIDSTFGWHNR